MNNNGNQFFNGFSSFFRATGFIFKHKLGAWYLAPFGIWLLTFITSILSINKLISGKLNILIDQYFPKATANPDGTWELIKNIFTKGLEYLATIVVYIFIFLILSRLTKYIVLIICSPILAYLSEVAEEKLTGRAYPFNLQQLLKDMIRGILITLRNLFLELLLIFLGFLISFFVPVLAPVVAILLYGINCYFMGFSMFDYVAERKRMGLTQSVGFMKQNTWHLVGLGFAFNLISLVPILEWVMAPINGAVGAVLALENVNSPKPQNNQNLLDSK